MTPGVSVVVVTYNHAAFIREALAGVFAQVIGAPIEVIVSDDASTDGTTEMVSRLAAEAGQVVRLLRSPDNLGSNVVTARAIEAARAPYVAIMDGDDVWTSPAKLDRQRRFLDAHADCAFCYHDVDVIDGEGRLIPDAAEHRDVPLRTALDDILAGNYVAGSAPMFRRSALVPVPHWVAMAPYGDWALAIAAARHGWIGRLPDVLGAYRRHAAGMWSRLTASQRAAGIVAFYDAIAPQIWPDRRDLLRHVRAGWRANLIRTLSTAGEDSAIAAAVDDGVRAGDLSRLRRSGSRTEHVTALGGLALGVHVDAGEAIGRMGAVDDCRWLGPDAVELIGWGPFRDDSAHPTLHIVGGPSDMEVVAARLTRRDVAAVIGPELRRSGFWLRVTSASGFSRPFRLWAGGPLGVWMPSGDQGIPTAATRPSATRSSTPV